MKRHFSTAVAAALFVTAASLATKAEDAAPAPAVSPAAPAAAPSDAGLAYWEPFPIYFPHLTRHHGVYWSRIPWFF